MSIVKRSKLFAKPQATGSFRCQRLGALTRQRGIALLE